MAHFPFSSESPGYFYIKNTTDANSEQKIKLLKDISWQLQKSSLPNEIIPDGLSVKRQWYLYEKVWEYCPEEHRDSVCPLPHKRQAPSTDDESSEDE